MPYGFIMRRKYFAGNFSACIITKMTTTCKKNLFKTLKVVDKQPTCIHTLCMYVCVLARIHTIVFMNSNYCTLHDIKQILSNKKV